MLARGTANKNNKLKQSSCVIQYKIWHKITNKLN